MSEVPLSSHPGELGLITADRKASFGLDPPLQDPAQVHFPTSLMVSRGRFVPGMYLTIHVWTP